MGLKDAAHLYVGARALRAPLVLVARRAAPSAAPVSLGAAARVRHRAQGIASLPMKPSEWHRTRSAPASRLDISSVVPSAHCKFKVSPFQDDTLWGIGRFWLVMMSDPSVTAGLLIFVAAPA